MTSFDTSPECAELGKGPPLLPSQTNRGWAVSLGREVPYLLAFLGLHGQKDVIHIAQFVTRRLGLEPDVATVERLLARLDIQSELEQPVGRRAQLAKIVDDFGMRSFRIEIEETAS